MRPLMSQKVQRGVKLDEWEPAEHHLSVDGLTAFAKRQRERMQRAQAEASETARKVRTLKAGR